MHLPEETTTDELMAEIGKRNADDAVCGILLEHPLPKQIDERACFDNIALEKDVDGITCLGFGRMTMGEKAYGSTTPAGIISLRKLYSVSVQGKNAVVVGRSQFLVNQLQ